ncbi:hypothetical protein JX265_000015 [Neoarthrinium moseri]|uniref:Uncharacterized protein n=1 Tax=Neoarthrinium moseri TaxID=1658444 RepID=A0A9P9WY02_9PEZI|nr:hypothetical protein JX265_000015 [Neoarthrinium moseri]
MDRNLEPGTIEVWPLDYLSYESVVAFAERAKHLQRLDIVVLNAGVYRPTLRISPSTGHEEDIQVNYLSTALLAILLLPILKVKHAGPERGRLIFVASGAAAWAKFTERESKLMLSAYDKPTKFDWAEQSAVSKLLAQLFLVEVAKHVPPSVAIITSVHPGFCRGSCLAKDADGTFLGLMVGILMRTLARELSAGAATIVDAAVKHGEEIHGQYLEDCELIP